MMGMFITGVILLCLLSLGFVRFGIRAIRTPDGKTRLILRAGIFRFDLLKRLNKRLSKTKKPDKKRLKEEKPSLTSAFKILPHIVMPALHSLRKGVRIDRLKCKLTVAGEEDPCTAAMLYGRLHMAWGILFPLLDQFIRIRKHRVEIKLDFDREETAWEGDFAVSISLGRSIAVMLIISKAYLSHRTPKNISRKAV
jgi:hypothetical protein